MKNIFFDSNIWLSLYAFAKDDLNQFTKLSDLIGRDVTILLPAVLKEREEMEKRGNLFRVYTETNY